VTRLGVVTGLAAEADCIHRAAATLPDKAKPLVWCAGANAERARSGAERLVAEGAGALLSFGIAGGLAEAFAPGGVVLADAVMPPQGPPIETDTEWRQRLLARLSNGEVKVATIAGSDRAVTTSADKRALRERTGAVAVDMESHGVALAAQAAAVPFLALRVIADPVGRAVPGVALHALTADGRPRPAKLLGSLALSPWQIVPLMWVAADSRRALRVLGRLAAVDPAAFALG
jgi:hopanoid-associated phosphorylase